MPRFLSRDDAIFRLDDNEDVANLQIAQHKGLNSQQIRELGILQELDSMNLKEIDNA